MPNEEVLFLWKFTPTLLGLGSGGRPVNGGGVGCNRSPASDVVNVEAGDDGRKGPSIGDLADTREGNFVLFLNPNEAPDSKESGGVAKCKELVAAPDADMGV